MTPIYFLFFIFLLIGIPIAYSQTYTMDAFLLPEGQKSVANDTIEETLDVSNDVVAKLIPVTKTIGTVSVDFTQEIKFVADNNDGITLSNTAVNTVSAKIPDKTIISGPATWDKTISPPVVVTGGGTVPTGFDVPTTSIQVGSSAVTLVFDKPVVITLNGVSGQTAYKLAGTNTWILISTCAGTFATPTDPGEPNECAISDGTNTKILTYHFTEFAGLTETPTAPATSPATTPSTKSSSSGGHGRTGVGPSSSGAKYFTPSIQTIQNLPNAPAWFLDVVLWEQQGKITLKEMFAAYQWILENKK